MKIILIVVLLAIASRKVESQDKCVDSGGTGTSVCTIGAGEKCQLSIAATSITLTYSCGTGTSTANEPVDATKTALDSTNNAAIVFVCDPAVKGDYCNLYSYKVVTAGSDIDMYAPQKCIDGARSLPAWDTPTESAKNCLYCKLVVSVDSDYTYTCELGADLVGTQIAGTTVFELPAAVTPSTTAVTVDADDYKSLTAEKTYECAGAASCIPLAEPTACVAGSPCFVTRITSTTPDSAKKWKMTACPTTNTTTLNTVTAISRVYEDLSYCCATCTPAASVSVLGKACHCQYTPEAGVQNCNDVDNQETEVYTGCAAVNLGEFVLRFGLKACTLTTTGLKFLEYTCCTDSNCLSGTVSGEPATAGFWGSLGGGEGCSSANNFYPTRIYLLISAAVMFFLLN